MNADRVPWVDGLTIAQVLEHTASRCADHDALVFPQLGYRLRYGEFLSRGAAGGAGPDCPRRPARRARRHLGDEPAALGDRAVRGGGGRRGAGQRQSRLPRPRATLCPRAGRHHRRCSWPTASRRPIISPCSTPSCPSCRRREQSCAASSASRSIGPGPDMPSWDAFLERANSVTDAALDYAQATVRGGRYGEHPVHVRHDRLPQGRDAHPSQPADQRVPRRRRPALHAERPHLHARCRCITASAASGHARLCRARRGDGRSRPRSFDAAGHARSDPGRALHRALRRADDVHRRAQPSALRRRSTWQPAHRASWPAAPARSR